MAVDPALVHAERRGERGDADRAAHLGDVLDDAQRQHDGLDALPLGVVGTRHGRPSCRRPVDSVRRSAQFPRKAGRRFVVQNRLRGNVTDVNRSAAPVPG